MFEKSENGLICLEWIDKSILYLHLLVMGNEKCLWTFEKGIKGSTLFILIPTPILWHTIGKVMNTRKIMKLRKEFNDILGHNKFDRLPFRIEWAYASANNCTTIFIWPCCLKKGTLKKGLRLQTLNCQQNNGV